MQTALDDIRAAKAEAEQEILAVLEKLRARTGFSAIECDLEIITTRTIGDKYQRCIVAAVVLSLESI